MKNKCLICGAACASKYCSKECISEARRRKYRENHPAYESFYVFYDKNDFVKCFGTAKQLVEDGMFSTENSVRSRASKIKSGATLSGNVVILKCEKGDADNE